MLRKQLQLLYYNEIGFQKELNLMSRITEELLRKRSEHNECCLTTLQQISLHQQQLIKIDNLDVLCRHLKIIYLQNNIIEKMENLNKLKELEYLNLALNNITRIQNIQGCESLKKLDLTVNFVDVTDLYDSVNCLAALPNLKQIYLTGNPCQNWSGCKDYVIANVQTLQSYNGQLITPSQRIKAKQMLPSLKANLFEAIQKRKLQKRQQDFEAIQRKKLQQNLSEDEKAKMKTPYTKEARRQMYEKMADDKERKQRQRNPDKYKQQKLSQMYTKNGQIRQCNEGKYHYTLKQYDDPQLSFFEIDIPRHLNTNDLQVNINPHWVSIRIKKQLTQLKLNYEIIVHESKSERSQITGSLLITMKKMQTQKYLRNQKEEELKRIKKQEEEKKKTEKQERERRLRLCDQYQKKMEKEEDQIPDLQ